MKHIVVFANRYLIAGFSIWLLLTANAYAGDPLPSWNKGNTKTAIINFVNGVTDKKSVSYVAPPERIATFDNDGTLWTEQPLYFQGYYALDRIKAMAKDHPEWKAEEPFKSVLDGDMKGLMATGKEGLMKLIFTSHAGQTAEQFSQSVTQWLDSTRHPQTDMLFTQMIFQPMLELMDYLRANEFKVFIVSGGGIDFIRVFSERVYGVPPENVVGSTIEAKFQITDGVAQVIKEPELSLIDDKEGKPVGIYRHIGRRPVLVGGNSDGDLQMLQYASMRPKGDKTPSFGLIVHHTDSDREYAYDRDSHIGTLDKAMDAAKDQGWVLVDMKNDWNTVYPSAP